MITLTKPIERKGCFSTSKRYRPAFAPLYSESGPNEYVGTILPIAGCGMSSKKARRRKLQEQTQENSRRTLSPAALFILGIGLAVVLTVAGAVIFGDRKEPPYPGAVWSEQHGHWH